MFMCIHTYYCRHFRKDRKLKKKERKTCHFPEIRTINFWCIENTPKCGEKCIYQ